jgi:hypothetical protein
MSKLAVRPVASVELRSQRRVEIRLLLPPPKLLLFLTIEKHAQGV